MKNYTLLSDSTNPQNMYFLLLKLCDSVHYSIMTVYYTKYIYYLVYYPRMIVN